MSEAPAPIERRPLVALALVAALGSYVASLLAPPAWLLGLMALSWASTIAAAVLRAPDTLQATLVLALMVSFTATVPVRITPLPTLLPLVVFAAVRWRLRRARAPLRWAVRGATNARVMGAALLVAAASVALWNVAARPELPDVRASLPPLTGVGLAGFALLFAATNAAIEAVLGRGVLQSAVEEAVGSPAVAALAQAATLGMAHFYDVPRGWRGVGAAFAQAAMLGALRLYAGGMLAPFVAHVAAALGIFASIGWLS